jgi:hypothetical protein
MNVKIERTEKEILIKLLLDTDISDIQMVLNYFKYVNLSSKSKATQEQIDKLAKEVNQGWWKKTRNALLEKKGLKFK